MVGFRCLFVELLGDEVFDWGLLNEAIRSMNGTRVFGEMSWYLCVRFLVNVEAIETALTGCVVTLDVRMLPG